MSQSRAPGAVRNGITFEPVPQFDFMVSAAPNVPNPTADAFWSSTFDVGTVRICLRQWPGSIQQVADSPIALFVRGFLNFGGAVGQAAMEKVTETLMKDEFERVSSELTDATTGTRLDFVYATYKLPIFTGPSMAAASRLGPIYEPLLDTQNVEHHSRRFA